MGDYINVNDMHHKQKSSNTLATVIGILLGVLVLVALFGMWNRNRDFAKNTEKNTDINLGEIMGEQRAFRNELSSVVRHEREDFGRIMYTDGALRPYYGYGGGYGYYDGGHGEHHGGCGGHGHGHGNCDSKFKDVKTFNLASEVVTQENVCNCR